MINPIRYLIHVCTHRHHRLVRPASQVEFCTSRRDPSQVRVFLQEGDADWVAMTRDEYIRYGAPAPRGLDDGDDLDDLDDTGDAEVTTEIERIEDH